MKILHYSFGMAPQRAGGLSKYATDLMLEEAKEHDVALLFPNGFELFTKSCKIKKAGIDRGIKQFRLVNAETVPLLYGIKTPQKFMEKKISKKSFDDFIKDFKPDVLHLHTLMGLPEPALSYFKKCGVRIVYTSHDYFGICTRMNFININGELCDGPSPEHCLLCNKKAPSSFYLKVRNSETAIIIRDIIFYGRKRLNLLRESFGKL